MDKSGSGSGGEKVRVGEDRISEKKKGSYGLPGGHLVFVTNKHGTDKYAFIHCSNVR